MPRKPKNRRPSSFSQFSRSITRQDRSSKLHKRSRLDSSDGLRDQSDEDKSGKSRLSDGEKIDQTIQADFDFCEPNPSYFHGLKVLLPTYLGNKQWDLSGFVDLILEQTTVGTIIKIDGDDTPYCFITALNFGKYKDHYCIQEVKAFLLNVCKEKETLQNLRSLLEEQATSVGLIVCQRVVNLPHQLLPPLYDTLFDEITHAIENKNLAGYLCFKYYIVITRIYEHRNGSREEAARRSSEEATIYTKAEDEIFLELSQWSFKFPLHTGKPANRKLKNYRLMGLVMAIEAEKISRFREQLHSWIDES